jgi:hypothetical protein
MLISTSPAPVAGRFFPPPRPMMRYSTFHRPVRRLDEVRAARDMDLAWRPAAES